MGNDPVSEVEMTSADLRDVLKRLGERWRQIHLIQEYLKRQLKREEERMIRSLYEGGR